MNEEDPERDRATQEEEEEEEEESLFKADAVNEEEEGERYTSLLNTTGDLHSPPPLSFSRHGRLEETTAQTGKGCLGQGVQTPLLAFF